MGTTGAGSAMVPWMKRAMASCWLSAARRGDQVDLVLQDDDVLQPHDLHRR